MKANALVPALALAAAVAMAPSFAEAGQRSGRSHRGSNYSQRHDSHGGSYGYGYSQRHDSHRGSYRYGYGQRYDRQGSCRSNHRHRSSCRGYWYAPPPVYYGYSGGYDYGGSLYDSSYGYGYDNGYDYGYYPPPPPRRPYCRPRPRVSIRIGF